MKFNSTKVGFGRHESFALRYSCFVLPVGAVLFVACNAKMIQIKIAARDFLYDQIEPSKPLTS